MSTCSPVRLVLFDLDGKLVDHRGAAAAAVEQWLLARGWADTGTAQLAVLSNGDQEQQEEKVSRTGLGRYIDVVLTSDQLGVAEPDPRIFELACGRLGVPPHAAVYVSDQLEVDALAATAAGLRGIWLNRTGDAVPPAVEAIEELAQLTSLIGGP